MSARHPDFFRFGTPTLTKVVLCVGLQPRNPLDCRNALFHATLVYAWRGMGPRMRREVLAVRKTQGVPWHGPPHYTSDRASHYLFTAACYEHRPVIGRDPQRLADFEHELVLAAQACCERLLAWVVLPNHSERAGMIDVGVPPSGGATGLPRSLRVPNGCRSPSRHPRETAPPRLWRRTDRAAPIDAARK